MACTVSGCSSRVGVLTENNENVSFHRFPADVDLKKSWVKNLHGFLPKIDRTTQTENIGETAIDTKL
ncbi:unnamed protein product [Arctia plantaginis]|uniref:THAP-type domain-containing protein n=1 Tax=Arctia plantaginis TaxID=874455 RepID=A0A8S0YZC0_ARCPL|nr:unnamed protein product [Arctia plantaginis]